VDVALKVNRNSSYDHQSSRTEIAILKKLKDLYKKCEHETSSYESEINSLKDKTVAMLDSFMFRNHYVYILYS
jgi:hypothetical protein